MYPVYINPLDIGMRELVLLSLLVLKRKRSQGVKNKIEMLQHVSYAIFDGD